MKRSHAVLVGILVLMVSCLALALLGYLLYSAQRSRAMEERPLVLIHAPLNREQLSLGQGVILHATARAPSGVARVELWIDGALVDVSEGPDEGLLFTLVLNTGWEPTILGPHVLLVRAVSVGGVEGQATVAVEVVEDEAEQLAEANPELGGDVPQPGDPVLAPDEAGDSGGEVSGEEPSSDDGSEGEAPAGPPLAHS